MKKPPTAKLVVFLLVPKAGLEPAWYCYRWILSSISQKEPLGTEWND